MTSAGNFFRPPFGEPELAGDDRRFGAQCSDAGALHLGQPFRASRQRYLIVTFARKTANMRACQGDG
jgi:hypothetical protein